MTLIALSILLQSPFVGDVTPIKAGYGFTEGPAWTGKQFVFCDMANDTVYSWAPGGGEPRELRKPSGKAVGSTSDGKGKVYQVDTANRRIVSWQETKPNDTFVVGDRFEGKRLGGMNDLALHKNGSIYATHATWFVDPATLEFRHSGVIRITQSGKVDLVADGLERPNGIAFAGNRAFVTEYSAGRIMTFELDKGGSRKGEVRLFADLNALAKAQGIKGQGGADGIRVAKDGTILSTGPGGIWALSPKAEFLGHLATTANNFAIGGNDGKTLLITTGRGVSSCHLK